LTGIEGGIELDPKQGLALFFPDRRCISAIYRVLGQDKPTFVVVDTELPHQVYLDYGDLFVFQSFNRCAYQFAMVSPRLFKDIQSGVGKIRFPSGWGSALEKLV
jgi:hypothetical protein